MQFRILARTAALSCTILATVGCQYSPDMTQRSLAYNQAVADSTNQLLLLDIVRSSKRYPRYYSRLEGDTATASITPTNSLTTPFNKGKSFETDRTLGAGLSRTTKDISAWTAISNVLGLSASEQNVLTLQSLDDEIYQNGMQNQVPLSVLKTYWDENYQSDLLMLMFVSRIDIRQELLDKIDAATIQLCSYLDPRKQETTNTLAFCNAFTSRGKNPTDVLSTANVTLNRPLNSCVRTRGATIKVQDGEDNIVTFVNDPARELSLPAASEPAPEAEQCFETLLENLLALGLNVNLAEPTYDVIDESLENSLTKDPRFRSTLIEQKIKYVPAAGTDPALLCSSKPGKDGFTLDLSLLNSMNSSTAGELKKALAKSAKDTAYKKKVGRCTTYATDDQPDSTDMGAKTDALSQVALNSKDIAFTTRSFESMVYYLGEIVRTEEQPGLSANVRVLGRSPASWYAPYTEALFYASKNDIDSDDAAFSVDVGEETYSVPVPCLTKSGNLSGRLAPNRAKCSVEHPYNESLVVLTLLGQIWGLEKQATTGPGISVTVPASPTP